MTFESSVFRQHYSVVDPVGRKVRKDSPNNSMDISEPWLYTLVYTVLRRRRRDMTGSIKYLSISLSHIVDKEFRATAWSFVGVQYFQYFSY